MDEANWIKVTMAALGGLFLAAFWYGPLFGNVWKARARASEEQIAARNPVIIFLGALIFCFVSAYTMHMYLGPNPPLELAIGTGVLVGACWAATSMGISALMSARPFSLYMVDAAFVTLLFGLYGAVYGLL